MATWLNFIIDSCAQPWLANASIFCAGCCQTKALGAAFRAHSNRARSTAAECFYDDDDALKRAQKTPPKNAASVCKTLASTEQNADRAAARSVCLCIGSPAPVIGGQDSIRS